MTCEIVSCISSAHTASHNKLYIAMENGSVEMLPHHQAKNDAYGSEIILNVKESF